MQILSALLPTTCAIILHPVYRSLLPSCQSTVSVALENMHGLRTFSADGAAKEIGGDELYVTIADGNGSPVAVATVLDSGGGRYELRYNRIDTRPENELLIEPHNATIEVVLQYTCGAGRLDPMLKHDWNSSGALNKVLLHQPIEKPLRSWEAQHQPSASDRLIDLTKYTALLALGDSMLRTLLPPEDLLAAPMAYAAINFPRDATPHALASAARQLPTTSRMLVLVGLGTWDLLENSGTESLSQFEEGLRDMFRLIRATFPNATLVLKSFSAVHPHRISCSAAICRSRAFGEWSCGDKCVARTKYLR